MLGRIFHQLKNNFNPKFQVTLIFKEVCTELKRTLTGEKFDHLSMYAEPVQWCSLSSSFASGKKPNQNQKKIKAQHLE